MNTAQPPAEATEVVEYDVHWLDIESHEWLSTVPTTDRAQAEYVFTRLDEVWGHHTQLRSRTVTTGPWTEVQP